MTKLEELEILWIEHTAKKCRSRLAHITTKETKMSQDHLESHRELLDRARRTETKLTNLINALGMVAPDDGKAECAVSIRGGITEVAVNAADTPLSAIKSSLIKAGFDPLKCDDVRIMMGGTTFGHINFT